jgi:hypothetical protein
MSPLLLSAAARPDGRPERIAKIMITVSRKGGLCGLAIALSVAGCASQQAMTQNTEQMLAAAGFLQKPADTPKREARLASLTPYHILSQRLLVGGQDTVGYVYADPQYCHCVYVGDPTAYQRFQQLALQQQMQQQQIAAADMAYTDSFGWGDWGPYPYWGGGDVEVYSRGGFASGGFHGGGHR